MAAENISHVVGQIVDDIAARAPFKSYADLIPSDFSAAYDIQDQVVEMLLERGFRSRVCGYKLAVNSTHLMAHFGISEPAAARMFSDQKHASPARLNAGDYRSVLIEPEIMAVIGDGFRPQKGKFDRDGIRPAIKQYFAAIELVDTRDVVLPKARLASVVAQNVTTEGLVYGGAGVAPGDLDVDALTVAVEFDGELVEKTTGSAPQHPLDAVAWLANHLAARGSMLKAGDIVMCGTHMPPRPLGDARHVCVDMGDLGRVEFSIA